MREVTIYGPKKKQGPLVCSSEYICPGSYQLPLMSNFSFISFPVEINVSGSLASGLAAPDWDF